MFPENCQKFPIKALGKIDLGQTFSAQVLGFGPTSQSANVAPLPFLNSFGRVGGEYNQVAVPDLRDASDREGQAANCQEKFAILEMEGRFVPHFALGEFWR